MERCAELCAESLTDERVLEFYMLAEQYGLPDLSEKCFKYLKNNFWRLSNKPAILCTLRLLFFGFIGKLYKKFFLLYSNTVVLL